jgi:hypothetical protein
MNAVLADQLGHDPWHFSKRSIVPLALANETAVAFDIITKNY